VSSRSRSPAHQADYVREVLAGLHVRRFLTPQQEVSVVHPGDRIAAVVDRLSGSSFKALPITSDRGSLLGVVSLEEVHLAYRFPHLGALVVAADLMRSDVTPLHPDDRLDRALELFVESNLLALLVVDGSPDRRVIGIASRADVSSTYLRYVHGAAQSAAGDGSVM
jgi:CBS domain-containing protein